jgi:hypothetical protein
MIQMVVLHAPSEAVGEANAALLESRAYHLHAWASFHMMLDYSRGVEFHLSCSRSGQELGVR